MMEKTRKEISLGDGKIICVRETNSASAEEGVKLINVHENEWSSIEAGRLFLAEAPAELFYFDAGGQRALSFECNGGVWRVDPNRIFSMEGVRQSLLKLNGNVVDSAVETALRFGRALIDFWEIGPAVRVVALHNTDGDYSVLSYGEQGEESHNAERVTIQSTQPIHDFFFVTDEALFDKLSTLGFNAVLQKMDSFTDDGSLSTYCAREGISYVNVEARYAATEDQLAMLQALLGAWS